MDNRDGVGRGRLFRVEAVPAAVDNFLGCTMFTKQLFIVNRSFAAPRPDLRAEQLSPRDGACRVVTDQADIACAKREAP